MKKLVLALLLVCNSGFVSADKYLGDLDSNRYNPNSVNNPYGQYGSKYSSDSINNPYGEYGSKYSSKSANNPYATEPPKLIERNGVISIFGNDE